MGLAGFELGLRSGLGRCLRRDLGLGLRGHGSVTAEAA